MKAESLQDLQSKNLETGMKLAQITLDNSQRLIALQLEITRKLVEDSIDNARSLTSLKDPQQILSQQTQYAQETAQTMMDAVRQLAEATATSRAEINHLFAEQFANGGKDFINSFQSLFGNIPNTGSSFMDSVQQSMSSFTQAYEQFAKASAASLTQDKPQGTAAKRRQA